MRIVLTVAIAVSAATATDARADDDFVEVDEEEPEAVYLPELRPPMRKIIGFDFGIGIFDAFCEQCRIQGGISADFFAGIQLGERIGVLVDLWSQVHLLALDSADERGFSAHSLATVAGRLWIMPTFWVQAGVGGGFLSILGPANEVDIGPGGTLSVGRELKHRPEAGIDLSLRVGTTRFRIDGAKQYIYNLSAVVGYHWN